VAAVMVLPASGSFVDGIMWGCMRDGNFFSNFQKHH
jgi:hypothetical protein